MLDPRRPTDHEAEEHNLIHIPYRSWCPICVRAKAKDLDHRKAADEERGLAEFGFDYCFPGVESGPSLPFWSAVSVRRV